MGRISQETKNIKNFVLKHSKDIRVKNTHLDGEFTITKLSPRAFNGAEVEVRFTGKIWVKLVDKENWFERSELKPRDGYRISTIKLHRFLKKNLIKDVADYLLIYNLHIYDYTQIKKVIWN